MTGSFAAATARRVLQQLRHDPRTVVLMLVMPSILVGLLAWIFTDTTVFAQVGPAMLGLFPFVLMFLVTSITTLRERRSGTLERLLTMPVRRLDIILGYALAFGLVAIAQATIVSWFAVAVCGLDLGGPFWQLILVSVLDAVLGVSLGLLASAFATTEFQVVQFMPLIVFPQILLGGIFVPRDQMPDVLEAVSDVLPLSHAVDALNHVSAGDPLWDAGGNIAVIVAWVLGSVICASLTLRRRTR